MRFGTDGIRYKVNSQDLSPLNVFRLGETLAEFLNQKQLSNKVVVCRDTRASSHYILAALVSGLTYNGVDVCDISIQPTGLLSRFIRQSDFSLGINITASHNPAEYNGFKFFLSDGSKMSRSDEQLIERIFHGKLMFEGYSFGKYYSANIPHEIFDFYLRLISEEDCSRFTVLVDCANGSMCELAKRIFPRVFKNVIFVGASPDGYNINRTGVMNLDYFIAACKESNVDFGFCFDGDGDRCYGYFQGHLIDGDFALALFSKYKNLIFDEEIHGVVGTVLSNKALEEHINSLGIRFYRSSVGDMEVLESMHRLGFELGGEPSGHILFKDSSVSDGLVTALNLSKVFSHLIKSNIKLTQIYSPYATEMRNYKIKERKPINELEDIESFLESQRLKGNRIVIRYSGTESVVRVYVESQSMSEVNDIHSSIQSLLLHAGII